MRNLQLAKRLLGGIAALILGVCMVLPHGQPAAPIVATRPAVTYPWTHQLAAQFLGCTAHLPAGQVATAFVVRRLDGHDERMAFDETWKRTHNQVAADDVWVEGQCP